MGQVLISVWQGASLLNAQPLGVPKQHSDPSPRGVITGFSASSRRRLQRLLATVRRDWFVWALFLTLTYPDEFPAMGKVKRDLDTFFKRVRRKFPKAAGVWRLEMKERETGKNAGQVAPHFHILVFGVRYLDYGWLARTWFEIVGSHDLDHLSAGTSIERVHNYQHAQSYISKYMTKLKDDATEDCGRFWGTFGNLEKYVGELIGYLLDQHTFTKIARQLDKQRLAWARGKKVRTDVDEKLKRLAIRRARKRKNFTDRGANWFADSDAWLKVFAVLLGLSADELESAKLGSGVPSSDKLAKPEVLEGDWVGLWRTGDEEKTNASKLTNAP